MPLPADLSGTSPLGREGQQQIARPEIESLQRIGRQQERGVAAGPKGTGRLRMGAGRHQQTARQQPDATTPDGHSSAGRF